MDVIACGRLYTLGLLLSAVSLTAPPSGYSVFLVFGSPFFFRFSGGSLDVLLSISVPFSAIEWFSSPYEVHRVLPSP